MEAWGNSCFLSVKQLPQELAIFHAWILDIFAVLRSRNCFLCCPKCFYQNQFCRSPHHRVVVCEYLMLEADQGHWVATTSSQRWSLQLSMETRMTQPGWIYDSMITHLLAVNWPCAKQNAIYPELVPSCSSECSLWSYTRAEVFSWSSPDWVLWN